MVEVPDEKIPEKENAKIDAEIKEKEGMAILKQIPKDSFVISLDLRGKSYSSEEFASQIESIAFSKSHIAFIIGGSLGLWENVLKQADCSICFSKMTFPHQLMRVILLEQIYRAFKIIHHESYHK